MSTTTRLPVGTNVAVLVGALTRPPELRALPSGEHVLSLELTVRPAQGPAESVPLAWFGAPPAAAAWPAGAELAVVGRVRRRFFRAGGATQSRTEVVVATAVPVRQGARARRAVADAVAALGE
jgi:single-strand DNA-binding protein